MRGVFYKLVENILGRKLSESERKQLKQALVAFVSAIKEQ